MSFEEFFREYYGVLVGSLRKAGYARESEDAAQQAMFDAHRRWAAIHPAARKRWVWVAAFRIARRLRGKPGRFVEPDPGADPRDPARGPADLTEDGELAGWLDVELDGLPERQREVFALSLAGFTDVEIAAALGIARPTVRRHRLEARRTLRARWEARFRAEDGDRRESDDREMEDEDS